MKTLLPGVAFVLWLLAVAVVLFAVSGCARPPERCPRCGNPYIYEHHEVITPGGVVTKTEISCSQCRWRWK